MIASTVRSFTRWGSAATWGLALVAVQAAAAPSALVKLEAEETPAATVLRIGSTEPIGRHVAWSSNERQFTIEWEGVADILLPPEMALGGRRVEEVCTEIGQRSGRSFARLVVAHSPRVRARAVVDPDDPRTLRVTLVEAVGAPVPQVAEALAMLAAFGPQVLTVAAGPLAVIRPLQLETPPVASVAVVAAANAPPRPAGFAPPIGETFGLLGAPFTRFGRAWDALEPARTIASAAPQPASLVALASVSAVSSLSREAGPGVDESPPAPAFRVAEPALSAGEETTALAGAPGGEPEGAAEPGADVLAELTPEPADPEPTVTEPTPVAGELEPAEQEFEPSDAGRGATEATALAPAGVDASDEPNLEAGGGPAPETESPVDTAPVNSAPTEPADDLAAEVPAPVDVAATAIPPATVGELEQHVPAALLASLRSPPGVGTDESGPGFVPDLSDFTDLADLAALAGVDDGSTRLRTVESSALGDGRILVLLQGDAELTGEVLLEAAPPRLRIDLAGVRNGVRLARGPLSHEPLMGYRIRQTGQDGEAHLVVTLDLQRLVPYELVQGIDGLALILGKEPPAAVPATMPTPLDVTDPASPQAAPRAGPTVRAKPGAPTRQAKPASDPPAVKRVAPSPSSLEGSRFHRYQSITVADNTETWVGEPISLDLKDADLPDLFRMFSRVSDLNVIVHSSLRDRTISLTLREVPWDQALALILESEGLGKKLSGNVMRIAPMNLLLQEETAKANLNRARELAGEMRSIVRTLSYSSGSDADALVRKTLSSRGKSMLDRRTNTLIISDIEPRVREIEQLLDLVDRPTRQVEIQARIVETTHDFSKATGIRWGLGYLADRAFGNSTNFSFPRSAQIDYAVNLPVSASTGTLGLSFRNILNTLSLDLAIQAAEQRGRARIVSQPHIVVLENHEAEIESGVQIPIVGTTAEEIEVTFVSASLRLQVEPRITQDNHVIMELNIENNQPVFIQSVGDNASIATRRAKTTVTVPSGGTTVIGGIYQVNEGSSSGRVPGISRVPLLGWLFRNKSYDVTNDELLIFVTPRVIER